MVHTENVVKVALGGGRRGVEGPPLLVLLVLWLRRSVGGSVWQLGRQRGVGACREEEDTEATVASGDVCAARKGPHDRRRRRRWRRWRHQSTG